MLISSPDFADQDMMPARLSCQGEGKSPAIILKEVPQKAKSLVLIVEDPDAPSGLFVHWLLFNVPVTSEIKAGSAPGKQGSNSLGENGYCSPCPPHGTHRYFFKLFALDSMLDLKEGISKNELENGMKGHVLEKAELIGLYQKK